jgi:DNA-binding FadR family transcriptional regulator
VREIRLILRSANAKGVEVKDFVGLDFDFHRRVAESTKNRLLLRLYEQIGPHHAVYSANVISIPGRMDRARAGHLRILEAIEARDVAAARKEALAHLRDAEQDLASAAGSS